MRVIERNIDAMVLFKKNIPHVFQEQNEVQKFNQEYLPQDAYGGGLEFKKQ